MQSITRKPLIESTTATCLKAYLEAGVDAFVPALDEGVLQCKVRFPLLEYAAELIFDGLDEADHMAACDRINRLERIGGYVIIGKLLWMHLPERLEPALWQAAQYIAEGTEWYVSDILGERVFGNALLQDIDKALAVLEQFSKHDSNLVVRAIGAGAHLAIKRGLSEPEAEKVFLLLLSLALSKDAQVKSGIGWAAKTTAKFHPKMVERYRSRIDDMAVTGKWFRGKVKIGLSRYDHAQGN